MLIYKLLGEQAEKEFARSWGISYGMNAATEWKDIVHETVKAAIIMAILERLCLTRPASWLEEHLDYFCVVRTSKVWPCRAAADARSCAVQHALLMKHQACTLFQKIAFERDHLKRLAD